MALIVIFLLGVGNFAMHKAVLESGHRMIGQFGLAPGRGARRVTLAVEFVILLAGVVYLATYAALIVASRVITLWAASASLCW